MTKINYFDGKFHEGKVRLVTCDGKEITGRTYRRQRAIMKFDFIPIGDPRRTRCDNILEGNMVFKDWVHFPPVEKDWKPEMIYAVEITTKSGKGLFWVLVNRTIAPGDTISIESASEKTE